MILIADTGSIEHIKYRRKKRHKMENNPPLNITTSYSLGICITNLLSCYICKTASYEHEQRKL
jgi:hypothetical protein